MFKATHRYRRCCDADYICDDFEQSIYTIAA